MTLYDLLGVCRESSAEDIRAAFKAKALIHHPDRGGDAEMFKQVKSAYDVLVDPKARSLYDQTGRVPTNTEDGHDGFPPDIASMFGPGGPGGMFGNMFGSMFGSPPSQDAKPFCGPDKTHDIGVTLSDLYHGKTLTVNMKRDILCTVCKGKGGLSFKTCSDCNGAGMRMRVQMMGPFKTLSQESCMACHQTGQQVRDKCATCKGRCVVECENSIQVEIQPGMREGEHIVFPRQCSESPVFEHPGDLHLVLRHADSDSSKGAVETVEWVRQKEADLACEITLTLAEALLGFSRTFGGDKVDCQKPAHPSGRELQLVWTNGPLYDRDQLCLPGWGMPRLRKSTGTSTGTDIAYGDLYVSCRIGSVVQTLTEAQREALRIVWPEWVPPAEQGVRDVRKILRM